MLATPPTPPSALAPLLDRLLRYYGDTPSASHADGHRREPGHRVTLSRWLDCCAALRITSRPVARRAFEQVCGNEQDATLDGRGLWLCLFFAFVRMRSHDPLAVRSSAEWQEHYEADDIIATAMERDRTHDGQAEEWAGRMAEGAASQAAPLWQVVQLPWLPTHGEV